MKNTWLSWICLFFLTAAAQAAVVTPSEKIEIEWTKEELGQGISKKVLYEDSKSKHMAIRLAESEKPHIHEEDLTAWLVNGRAVFHIEEKSYELAAGDIARVPKHVTHWAEIQDGEICEVYAIYHKSLEA